MAGCQRGEHGFGGMGPQAVEHRVKRPLGAHGRNPLAQIVTSDGDGVISANRAQPLESLGVAACHYHAFRAENVLGELHRHRPGDAGRTEHQHVVTGQDRSAVLQRHPGRESGVGTAAAVTECRRLRAVQPRRAG